MRFQRLSKSRRTGCHPDYSDRDCRLSSRGSAAEKLPWPSLLCVLIGIRPQWATTDVWKTAMIISEVHGRVTNVQAPRSWTRLADRLATSGAAITLVWCGHDDRHLRPGGSQSSVPTGGDEVDELMLVITLWWHVTSGWLLKSSKG